MAKLVQLEKTDLQYLRDWRNSDEIRSRTREYSLLNMVNQEDWFERVSRDRSNEMFGIHINGRLVGVCGLCYIDWVARHAEVSIYIGDIGYRGKGYGLKVLKLLEAKAFNEFNLHRLWAEIFDNNPASIALFEKAGYTLEGAMRQHAYKDGKYRDTLLYGLVRND